MTERDDDTKAALAAISNQAKPRLAARVATLEAAAAAAQAGIIDVVASLSTSVDWSA